MAMVLKIGQVQVNSDSAGGELSHPQVQVLAKGHWFWAINTLISDFYTEKCYWRLLWTFCTDSRRSNYFMFLGSNKHLKIRSNIHLTEWNTNVHAHTNLNSLLRLTIIDFLHYVFYFLNPFFILFKFIGLKGATWSYLAESHSTWPSWLESRVT